MIAWGCASTAVYPAPTMWCWRGLGPRKILESPFNLLEIRNVLQIILQISEILVTSQMFSAILGPLLGVLVIFSVDPIHVHPKGHHGEVFWGHMYAKQTRRLSNMVEMFDKYRRSWTSWDFG